jgi:hypothetical protein
MGRARGCWALLDRSHPVPPSSDWLGAALGFAPVVEQQMMGSALSDDYVSALLAIVRGPMAMGVRVAASYDGNDREDPPPAVEDGGRLMPSKMVRTRYPGIFKRGSKYVVT